jgi:hypothetical protein
MWNARRTKGECKANERRTKGEDKENRRRRQGERKAQTRRTGDDVSQGFVLPALFGGACFASEPVLPQPKSDRALSVLKSTFRT